MTGLYLVVAAGHETRNSVGGGCVLWDWVGPVHCGRTSSQSDDIQQGSPRISLDIQFGALLLTCSL